MKNQCNFARSSRERFPQKGHIRHMLEVEESYQAVVFMSVSQVRPFRKILAKHSAWRIFKSDFFIFHPYYIYPHYPQKYQGGHSVRKTLDSFSTTHTHTHTPIFQRESYSFLMRNHSNLFSFPLPLYTLGGDLYPNTIHTFSKCKECFGAQEDLGICQKKPMRLTGCNQAYCEIRKGREDMTQRSSLVV